MPAKQQLTETASSQNETPAPEAAKPAGKGLFSISFGTGDDKKFAKINPSLVIKYVYPTTIVVVIGILIWFFYFLYNNVYLTMAQAEIVSGLKVKVVSEKLNKDKFNEIIKKIGNKNDLAKWDKAAIIKTPFNLGARNNYMGVATTTILINASSTKNSATSSSASTTVSTTAKTATVKPTTTKATSTKK